MKKILFSFFLIVLSCNPAYSQPRGGSPGAIWQEIDGSPSDRPRTIVVSNDVISFVGNIMSLDVVGQRDIITVNGSAVDTTANFLNGDIVWTLTDGGAGGPDAITGTFNIVTDTTPQLGGNLDTNQKSILFDSLPDVDDTWNGKTFSHVVGESITKNDVVYLKSDSKFWLADGDVEASTKGYLAMSTGAYVTNDTAVLLEEGYMRDDGDFAYTVGAVLWVPLTPGDPTETVPPGVGDYVRRVGTAISADVVKFKPSATWLLRK